MSKPCKHRWTVYVGDTMHADTHVVRFICTLCPATMPLPVGLRILNAPRPRYRKLFFVQSGDHVELEGGMPVDYQRRGEPLFIRERITKGKRK